MNEGTSSAVDEVRSRLFADLPGMTGVQDIMFAVRSQRTMAREGRTASGIEYSVHGAGCRMTDEDGREVDVDLIPDPHTTIEVEAFDVWRIKLFLSSNGYHPPPNGELNAACEQLAACGEPRVVEQGRWFALPPSMIGEQVRNRLAKENFGGRPASRCGNARPTTATTG